MVVADAGERASIDQILSRYAVQSGVLLKASAMFTGCYQAGGRQIFRLRDEMTFLGRTFRATWEKRDDGYFLNAEKSQELAPEKQR